jgi:hypothetical protein
LFDPPNRDFLADLQTKAELGRLRNFVVDGLELDFDFFSALMTKVVSVDDFSSLPDVAQYAIETVPWRFMYDYYLYTNHKKADKIVMQIASVVEAKRLYDKGSAIKAEIEETAKLPPTKKRKASQAHEILTIEDDDGKFEQGEALTKLALSVIKASEAIAGAVDKISELFASQGRRSREELRLVVNHQTSLSVASANHTAAAFVAARQDPSVVPVPMVHVPFVLHSDSDDDKIMEEGSGSFGE